MKFLLMAILAPATLMPCLALPNLHWAASQGDAAKVQSLLEQGASPTETDPVTGGTALHWAANKGCAECISILVNYDADIEAVDMIGRTPLFAALESADPHHLGLLALLRAGANTEARSVAQLPIDSNHMVTPIQYAVLAPSRPDRAIRYLRMYGADPNAVTIGGITALHIAMADHPHHGPTVPRLPILQALFDGRLDPNQQSLDMNPIEETHGENPILYGLRYSKNPDINAIIWLQRHAWHPETPHDALNTLSRHGCSALDMALWRHSDNSLLIADIQRNRGMRGTDCPLR